MFKREIGSKRGSLPPKEGDLTCMIPILIKGQHKTHFYHWNNTSFPFKKALVKTLTYAISSNPRRSLRAFGICLRSIP